MSLAATPAASAVAGPLSARLAHAPRAFTYGELVGLCSERTLRTAIARGEVVRLLPDAYVAALHADSFAARVDAALLWAGPRAVLSGPAALFIWGFIVEPPEVIDIVVPRAEHPRPPAWIRIRRVSYSPPTVRVGGAPVVGAALAVVLGYGLLPQRYRAEVLFRAVRSRLTSPASLEATLAWVPRCPARHELARRIESATQGAESYLEERGLRRVFTTREFAGFLRQHRVRAAGEIYRLDMFDPETMTAVELDGDGFHSDPEQRKRDLRRDANLATVGIQTIRLTYGDITENPEWCRAVVRQVLAARRR